MEDYLIVEQLKKEYPRYQNWSDYYTLILHEKFLNEYTILEFDEQSIDTDKTIKGLNDRFSGKFKAVTVKKGQENVILILFNKPNFFNIENINKYMKSFGWNVSTINGIKEENCNLPKEMFKDNIVIQYEARFDEEVENIPDILYHLTPDIRYEKIERLGLVPKSKSKITTHPERIYFFTDLKMSKWLKDELYENEPIESKNKIEKYFLLEIDYRQLKNKFKLYIDPNLTNGVYMTGNVPPLYITKIDEFNI